MFKTIKKTAKKINKKVIKRSKKRAVASIESVNKKIEMFDVTKGIKQAKSTAKDANDFTLNTTDKVVDGVFDNSKKVMNLTDKAVKGSLELAERQQEMVFDTLETIKEQFTESAKRLKKIVK